MVKLLRLLLLLLPAPLLFAASAAAQVTISAQEAPASYSIRSIAAGGQEMQGKVIKLQFVTRSTKVDQTADGGVTGQVVDSPDTRLTVNVQVPKAAVAWFMSLPTTYAGGAGYTVYARLSTDKFGSRVATLLGRKLHPLAGESGGSALGW